MPSMKDLVVLTTVSSLRSILVQADQCMDSFRHDSACVINAM